MQENRPHLDLKWGRCQSGSISWALGASDSSTTLHDEGVCVAALHRRLPASNHPSPPASVVLKRVESFVRDVAPDDFAVVVRGKELGVLANRGTARRSLTDDGFGVPQVDDFVASGQVVRVHDGLRADSGRSSRVVRNLNVSAVHEVVTRHAVVDTVEETTVRTVNAPALEKLSALITLAHLSEAEVLADRRRTLDDVAVSFGRHDGRDESGTIGHRVRLFAAAVLHDAIPKRIKLILRRHVLSRGIGQTGARAFGLRRVVDDLGAAVILIPVLAAVFPSINDGVGEVGSDVFDLLLKQITELSIRKADGVRFGHVLFNRVGFRGKRRRHDRRFRRTVVVGAIRLSDSHPAITTRGVGAKGVYGYRRKTYAEGECLLLNKSSNASFCTHKAADSSFKTRCIISKTFVK